MVGLPRQPAEPRPSEAAAARPDEHERAAPAERAEPGADRGVGADDVDHRVDAALGSRSRGQASRSSRPVPPSTPSSAPSSVAIARRAGSMSTATIRAGGGRPQDLDGEPPEPADPDHHAVEPSPSSGRARRTAWCEVAPASVSGPAVRGSSAAEGQHLAHRGDDIAGQAAVAPVARGRRRPTGTRCPGRPGSRAAAAGARRGERDRVALGQAGHALTQPARPGRPSRGPA